MKEAKFDFINFFHSGDMPLGMPKKLLLVSAYLSFTSEKHLKFMHKVIDHKDRPRGISDLNPFLKVQTL